MAPDWRAVRAPSTTATSEMPADQLDRDTIRRLIGLLSRALEPDAALALQAPELQFLESRPYGGAYLLDQL